MSFDKSFLISLLFLAIIHFTNAITDEDKQKMREKFAELAEECSKEVPISEEDAKIIEEGKQLNNDNSACFISCALKKIGILEESGKLSKEGSLEAAEALFEDENTIAAMSQLVDVCLEVNEKEVSGDEKSCNRAKLVVACFVEHAPNFDLELH